MAAVLLDAEVTIVTADDRVETPPGGLVLPIVGSDGAALGHLYASRVQGDAFSPEDQEVIGRLAQLTGARLESLHLYEREHRLAGTLQASIIPARLPEVPGLVLAAHYSPGNPEAEVGGDWYDALDLPGGYLAIAAGDVVGRGVHAAAIMGQLRNAFRAFLLEGYTPADALGRLNGLVNTLGDAYFCTVAGVLIDPSRGFARVASAGHTPPLVVTSEGSVRFQELVPSVAIGAVDDAAYSDTALMLHAGDTLLLYTDGLIERRGRSLDEGLDLLLEAASETGGDPAILVDHIVNRMMERGVGEDDVAAIAITVLPALTEQLTLRVPALPSSLVVLRRHLRRRFEELGLAEEQVFDLVLATSEAAANAIEHAADPAARSIIVSVSAVEGRVVVAIRDFGRWKEAAPEEDRGRGLELIRTLIEAPSIQRSPDGTVVSFRAPLSGDPVP